MDLRRQVWSKQCLDVFGIKEEMLPRIVSNAEVYGSVASGLLQGVPICGCLGDQQAALLGKLHVWF
jgi:glycerol kinase